MATVYSDGFTTLGAGWTEAFGEWQVSGEVLYSGTIVAAGAILVTNSGAHTALADQKVSITQVSTTGFDGGPIARYVDSNNFYYADVTGTSVTLYRRDNSAGPITDTQIGSPGTITTGAGKVCRLEVTGTGATVTLKVYYDGTLEIDTTDSSVDRITGAGYAGVLGWHTDDQFDNFLLEDTAAAGPGSKPGMTVNRGVGRGINRGAVRYPTKR